MIHPLTSHTGIDALNHFHTVVDVQRDDKRQQAEWRASRARKATDLCVLSWSCAFSWKV